MANTDYKSIDQYLKTLPENVQSLLQDVRALIKKEVSDASEAISYQIPVFKLKGRNLIFFAGWKNHISIYPVPKGDGPLLKELSPYIKGKGTLSFSIDKPLPTALIKKVVRYRVKEMEENH